MDNEWTYVVCSPSRYIEVVCNLCGRVFPFEDEAARIIHRLYCPPKDFEIEDEK